MPAKLHQKGKTIVRCSRCMRTRYMSKTERMGYALAIVGKTGKDVTCGVCHLGFMRKIMIIKHTQQELEDSRARSAKETKTINRSYAARKGWQARREGGEDVRQYGTRLAIGFKWLNGVA